MQNLNLRGLISFKKHSFKNRYGKYFSLGPILHPLDKCFAPMLPFKTPYFASNWLLKTIYFYMQLSSNDRDHAVAIWREHIS